MKLFSQVNLDTFRQYSGLSLPRHVAYPMPTWWDDALSADEAQAILSESEAQTPGRELSLYIHVPFCEALCKFCACNRIIQRHTAPGAADRTTRYVEALKAEIRMRGGERNRHRSLKQIHWGGGSPSYLKPEVIEEIYNVIRESFNIADDAEISIELDPRTATDEHLVKLRELGFNRVSLGVQDFEHQVQEHVRRIQPYEMVRDFVNRCRELGFESVNFDLIYGLPYQTIETVHDTVLKTIELQPDRIAFYHYAQIPQKIATQRGMDYTKLPDSETKLRMFLNAVETFEANGYDFIGLDHFAKKEEMLAKAMREGTLQRNFQGMTTGGGLDLIGVGPSSISHLQDIGFLQNVRDPDPYIEMIEAGQDPICKGKRFTDDDILRQELIEDMYCQATVRPEKYEQKFGINFAEYFSRELEALRELEADGLVTIGPDHRICATYPLGRVLLRNVAAVFDAYLNEEAYRAGALRVFSANA